MNAREKTHQKLGTYIIAELNKKFDQLQTELVAEKYQRDEIYMAMSDSLLIQAAYIFSKSVGDKDEIWEMAQNRFGKIFDKSWSEARTKENERH